MAQVLPAQKHLPQFDFSPLLSHFIAMMGTHGLYQHATMRVPLLSEGYCTDDNTRGLQTLLQLRPLLAAEKQGDADRLLQACWRFLQEAHESGDDYYNFRDATGVWLPAGRSDDMYARLIRAYSWVRALDTDTARRDQAIAALSPLLERGQRLTSARAWAEINVALAALSVEEQGAVGAQSIVANNQQRLLHAWQHEAQADWSWFEPVMTYANALLPHGVLAAAAVVPEEDSSMLEGSTEFLITTTIKDDMFIPIGSNGWYPRGGQPSRDNQQPIEAGTMTDFLLDYERAYPGKLAVATLIAPYLWFFGHNTHQVVMADEKTGACFDGLFASGPNMNCGAESMLAYLWAEVRMQGAPDNVREAAYAARAQLLRTLPSQH